MTYTKNTLGDRAGPNEVGLVKTSDGSLGWLSDEDGQMLKIIGPMTDERYQEVDALVRKIGCFDDMAIAQYGQAIQRKVARFSETMLSTVTDESIKLVYQLLTELSSIVKGYNPERTPNGKKPFFGLFKKGNKRTAPSIEEKDSRIQSISKSLGAQRLILAARKTALNQLYEDNRGALRDLEIHILAGRRCLEAFTSYGSGGSQEDVSIPQLSEAQYVSLGERITDLETTITICIQMACQIELVRDTYGTLIDRLGSYTTNTVAAWRNQSSLAIGIERGHQATEELDGILDAVDRVTMATDAITQAQPRAEISERKEG